MYVRLDEFRTTQTRRKFPFVITFSSILLLLSTIILATELVRYSDAYNDVNRTFGNDVKIGGVQVGGMNEADRLARLESVYVEQPVLLHYKDSPILLMPSAVGFRLDTDSMQAAANTQVENDFWGGFWKFLWRNEARSLDIPLTADFDPTELRNYLQELSLRYDSQANGVNFDLATFTFRGSEERTQLDIETAIPMIERALFALEPAQRVINLPLTSVAGQQPTMDSLRQSIIDYLQSSGRIFYDGPDTAVSVFVMDLESGEEMGIFPNLQVSGVSTIKVGVLINYFRTILTEPPADEKFRLGLMVICSDNGAANTIIDRTGDQGNWANAFRRTNDTMCRAGAVNSGIGSHIYIGPEGTGSIPTDYYTIYGTTPCPGAAVPSAELEQSINTSPDPYNYTTAADIGTMLMQIYDCAIHGGGIRSIFPDEITQTECQYIIELLKGTHFLQMMELGVPEGVEIAHKVGYFADIFGDAGIVFSPGGDYIFVMYVWEVDRENDGLTDVYKWPMIGDVSRIVYNYFNPDQPLLQTRTPVSELGGAFCVMPASGYDIDLTDINAHRLDEYNNPIPGESCYAYPECRLFDNWGRN